jgi:hypothetical protein
MKTDRLSIFLAQAVIVIFFLVISWSQIIPKQEIAPNQVGNKKTTTYYVDMDGDDRNDGLSPEKAWQTVNKVNKSNFKPGDIIRFKRGGVWKETLIVPSSGKKDSPITFTSYGKGAYPRFDGTLDLTKYWVQTGINGKYYSKCPVWTNQLFKNGERVNEGKIGYLLIDEFKYDRGKIYYRPPPGHNPAEYEMRVAKLKNCIICNGRSHIVFENLDCFGSQGTSRGIGQVVLIDGEDIIIRKCKIHHSKGFGVSLVSMHDVVIDSCIIHDVGLTGIGTSGEGRPSCNVIVSNNKIFRVGWLGMDRFNDGHAIGVGNLVGCHNWIIEKNEIYECGRGGGEAYNDGGCGPAITAWETHNITIRYSYIHDNYRGGISLELGGQSDGNNHRVYFNIIRGNGRNHSGRLRWGTGWSGICVYKFASTFEVKDIQVFNNIIYNNYLGFEGGSSAALYFTVAGPTPMTNVIVKNNIVYNNGTTNYEYWRRTPTVHINMDNNLLYRTNGINYLKNLNNTYSHLNFNKFKNDTRCKHCLSADPLFVDPSAYDFHLQSNSPCLQKGALIPGFHDSSEAKDYEGKNFRKGTVPSLGVYHH